MAAPVVAVRSVACVDGCTVGEIIGAWRQIQASARTGPGIDEWCAWLLGS